MKSYKAKRICLKCNRSFKSDGPFNRICSQCKLDHVVRVNKHVKYRRPWDWGTRTTYRYPAFCDNYIKD